jgi:transcription-repair coupling factor (superfamily II helicase)
MQGLFHPLMQTNQFKSLSQGLDKQLKRQAVIGLSGSQRSFLIGGVIRLQNSPVLVVTTGEAEAIALVDELGAFLPDNRICYFPAWQLLPFQVLAHDQEAPSRRLNVLEALGKGESLVVVSPIEALLRRLSPPEAFLNTKISVKVGDKVDLRKLKLRLLDFGYEYVELAEGRGQFSSRGGIIDIFPLNFERPFRIEFFDEEVDSIRFFDEESQRSEENVQEITFFAARELVTNEEIRAAAQKRIEADYHNQLKRTKRAGPSEAGDNLVEFAETVIRQLQEGVYSLEWEQLLPYFYPRAVTLFDYLPADSPVFIDDPVRIKEIAESIGREREQLYTELMMKGKVLPMQPGGYVDWCYVEEALSRFRVINLSLLPRKSQDVISLNTVSFATKSGRAFHGHLETLFEEIKYFLKIGYIIVLVIGDKKRAFKLQESLIDAGINSFATEDLNQELKPGQAVIALGALNEGFEFVSGRLVVITENEIFNRPVKNQRERRRRAKVTEPFAELKVGDFVVHQNHGIGRFQGIVSLEIEGIQKEYLLVQYAGEDRLYVPADQVGLVQKYLGAEAEVPRLSRLGGSEWSRVKGRVKEAVREIAGELLALYAARQKLPGYAFNPDTVWQREFEASFPYEETPDQLRTVEEVKADMEKGRPMDRLLCGDVGYGKTEVALRAAFKAVTEGKQVAVLVPTTILAQQHYNTFTDRFNGFPVSVEMLSRFRSSREQRRIVSDLRAGKVDVVIGTHRLVQEDIVFKDLGLVVVDEEQRFGVAHKEKLKKIKENVDVLTLTATPIPRTLHMSMVGVRDTSLIQTPPENRFPVQTYVLEEDAVLIREAIRREIGRRGQVYFVHNRVVDLDSVAYWLQGLVPEARIVAAHGQMREDELEQVMFDFVNYEYDILVCTTIIENGMDIPNVNTLIVKDAQNLGLAQLYQLRGRVGRSNKLAYAYFTFPRNRIISEVAEKRLAAIREFTEFGSGYKIALKDLEIRGAGNLLGPEQHGHIAAVGFDLYCRLLEEAVMEAKGETVRRAVDTSVEMPVEAYIPSSYVPDSDQKIDLYRRLASFRREDEILDMEEELVDRYGDQPEPVRNLLMIARSKVLASQAGVKNLTGYAGGYRMQFHSQHSLSGDKLVAIVRHYQNQVKFSNSDEFEIRLKTRISPLEPISYLTCIEEFLRHLL